MLILTLNCGSSSIKFQLIDTTTQSRLMSGLFSEIGTPHARLAWAIGEQKGNEAHPDIRYNDGVERVLKSLYSLPNAPLESVAQIEAVGHRVVHGGEQFSDATLITPAVVSAIQACIPLAPLHNPANLQGIEVCQSLLPDIPQVAVFDTAFHQTLPEQAYLYALPYRLYQEHGIRRYGFHGTSHRYVSGKAAEWLGREGNFISLHLGNGCSATAIRNGKSVDTSLGLTPLEGLVMGTRSGDIDPSLVWFIAERENLSLKEVDQLLNRQSGLKGLSEGESDMQRLLAMVDDGDPRAQRALDVFCYRAKKYIGAFMATLGQVDGIIFTGGIGENAAPIRARICEGLEPLGIEIDPTTNNDRSRHPRISTDTSHIALLVIPTNEELMIALDTQRILQNERTEL
jgi:acetate kinase